MYRTLALACLTASACFAQAENQVFVRTGSFGASIARGFSMSTNAVQGSPYSATITNQSVQTLADGNRIVQNDTGNIARDSMGRTRQDAPLPMIGNMSPADAPHLVVIQDPVAQTSYTLNLTDKTATKGSGFGFVHAAGPRNTAIADGRELGATVEIRSVAGQAPLVPGPLPMILQKQFPDEGQAQTEDLGSKTMEGVNVTGTRTTRTIPAGQIGNDKPINIVTEVWTSPELKTIVYSKRSDPRMGEQTFQLTNITRAEPDPTLFNVPADFKIVDAPEPIHYKPSGVPAQ